MNWILARIAKFLFNEKGEVPETPADGGDEPGPTLEPSPEPSEEAPGASQARPAEESFIDPASLPEELKPHWKRMHGSYTKFKQSEKQLRQQAEMVARFNTDPEFARATMLQRAAEMGFQLVPFGSNGQQQVVTQRQRAGNTPQQFLELAQSKLPPELHWMAPSIAESAHAIVQAALEPLVKQQRDHTTQARDREYDDHEAKLSEKHPGWEEHEDTMDKLLKWWQSDSLSHPMFGSKLELLYKMATDQASSVSEATRRINGAVRNRSSSSQTTSSGAPNIVKRVREAKSNEEAWDTATKYAVEQVKGRAG